MSYGALITGSAAFAGLDQGIDFTGRGLVHALAGGRITRIQSSGSGWPGEGAIVAYQITEKGSPLAGRYLYIAEDFAPIRGLGVGSQVRKGQILGLATGSGRAPGIETGFAYDAQGHAYGNPSEGHSGPPDPQAQALDSYVKAASSSKGSGGILGAFQEAGKEVESAAESVSNAAGGAAKAAGIPTPKTFANEAAESLVGTIAPEAMKILLYAVFVFGALALMGYGVATMISPRPPSLRGAATGLAKRELASA